MPKPKMAQALRSILILVFALLDLFFHIKIAGLLPILLGLLMLVLARLSHQDYQENTLKIFRWTAVIAVIACFLAFFEGFYQIQAAFRKQIESASGSMYIQKAELTEQEKAMAELLGADQNTYLLDFFVDDTVKTLQFNTYEYVDGSWQMISGGSRQLEDSYGKIAFQFDNIANGIRTAVQSEHENR